MMPSVDRSLIAGLAIFEGLSAADQDEILHDARALRVAKDGAVFTQGHEADRCFLMLHGHVRVEKVTPHGQHVIVRYISSGELFGVAQALGLTHYPATAVAAVDSIVLTWPTAVWARLTQRFPSLVAAALKTVGVRLQDAQAQVIELSNEQAEQRVANALLRLLHQAGRPVETGVEIEFPITRQDIAEMTGTTLHTVSRILSAWKQQNVVDGGRQHIVIRDTARLNRLAH